MSTMLLIERIPTLSIFARNHCGLGPTFTLSILRAEKNGHSRVAEIFTQAFANVTVLNGRVSERISLFVSAAISRASPTWLSKSTRSPCRSSRRVFRCFQSQLLRESINPRSLPDSLEDRHTRGAN